MLNTKTLIFWTLAAVLSPGSATPVNLGTSIQYDNVTVEVCSEGGDSAIGCVIIPVVSDDCINLTGGFSGLNKEISAAVVPDCFICKFFQAFGCTTDGIVDPGTDSEVDLPQGSWDFSSVPGFSGTTNFEDLTSSFACFSLVNCGY
ncbi:hypothetical protein K438DRAFT_1818969 [Mycena galopus ATCC 62051]|nr:hypothetical protein K438DRAFT_1818969 [Mycena galopus ATCC 62051]